MIEDCDKLGVTLENCVEIVKKMQNGLQRNNEKFCKEFEKIVDDLV